MDDTFLTFVIVFAVLSWVRLLAPPRDRRRRGAWDGNVSWDSSPWDADADGCDCDGGSWGD